MRFLALGDSYTIGESVEQDERWPNQLAALLRTKGVLVEVTVLARTGWTTDELWEAIQLADLRPPFDLVSLLIGVNNQYRGYDMEQYRKEFMLLLDRSIDLAKGDPGRVLVLSIPDWGVTPFASDRNRVQIAREIDHFNLINREESTRAGARYVDITAHSRMAAQDQTLIAGDGLHPSGNMYAYWVDQVFPVVLSLLN